jgi:hypothetical protein
MPSVPEKHNGPGTHPVTGSVNQERGRVRTTHAYVQPSVTKITEDKSIVLCNSIADVPRIPRRVAPVAIILTLVTGVLLVVMLLLH